MYEKYIKSASLRGKIEKIKSSTCSEILQNSCFSSEDIELKRQEVRELSKKYGITESITNYLIEFYLVNSVIPSGSMTKTVDFIYVVLKNIYGYSYEEVSVFLNKNLLIMKSSYNDFRIRLAIFNHIGLLEDILFHGSAYLTHEFTINNFGTSTLYALIMANNITNIEELNDVIRRTPDNKLVSLRKMYPLTNEIVSKLDEELRNKIKKGSFRLLLKQRAKNN